MRIRNREFDVANYTYIMGILNVTPDSFSDGGKYNTWDKALFRAQEMVQEGADILDIGGESTRPGHIQISEEEEISRTAPLIRRLREEFDIPLSIDTYKTAVAREALAAGADLVNDIWGLKYEPGLGELIAESGAACCLMHNRREPAKENLMEEIKADLRETLSLAQKAGICKERILLDPGIGFGKTYQQNLETLYFLEQLQELGYPLLLGASRKSVVGLTLDLPVQERLEGTLVTTVLGVLKGCAFIRVHDIKENVRAVQMARAICDGWR